MTESAKRAPSTVNLKEQIFEPKDPTFLKKLKHLFSQSGNENGVRWIDEIQHAIREGAEIYSFQFVDEIPLYNLTDEEGDWVVFGDQRWRYDQVYTVSYLLDGVVACVGFGELDMVFWNGVPIGPMFYEIQSMTPHEDHVVVRASLPTNPWEFDEYPLTVPSAIAA